MKLYLGGALNRPGLEGIRAATARAILTYHRDFLRDRGGDPALLADAAEASLRVGLLTTGIGDKRDALQALEQARPLPEALARRQPGDLAPRTKLAKCHDQIGFMRLQLDRIDEALAAQRRACDVHPDLVAAYPENRDSRRLLGQGDGNLANAYSISGKWDLARNAYERATRADGARPARPAEHRVPQRSGHDAQQPGPLPREARADAGAADPGPGDPSGPGRVRSGQSLR